VSLKEMSLKEKLIELLEKIEKKDKHWIPARGEIVILMMDNPNILRVLEAIQKEQPELSGAISNVVTTMSLSRWHL